MTFAKTVTARIKPIQPQSSTVGGIFGKYERQHAVAAIRSGASADFLPAFAKELNLPSEQLIAALALPRSTIKRNQGLGKALSHETTDRMYRATRVYESAVQIFEDQPAAVRWLQRPRAAFNGASALSLVDTTPGYELVLAELGRIEAGVVA
jgi:putative toxin-antitoxin system antitoxin component (TIGR02293 family)